MADLPKVSVIESLMDTKNQIRELKTYLVRLVDEIESAFEEIDKKIEELSKDS